MIDEKTLREMAFAALRSVDCRVDKDTVPAAMEAIHRAYESAKRKEAEGMKLFGLKVVVDETLPPDVIEIRGRAANGDVHRVYAMLSAAGDGR